MRYCLLFLCTIPFTAARSQAMERAIVNYDSNTSSSYFPRLPAPPARYITVEPPPKPRTYTEITKQMEAPRFLPQKNAQEALARLRAVSMKRGDPMASTNEPPLFSPEDAGRIEPSAFFNYSSSSLARPTPTDRCLAAITLFSERTVAVPSPSSLALQIPPRPDRPIDLTAFSSSSSSSCSSSSSSRSASSMSGSVKKRGKRPYAPLPPVRGEETGKNTIMTYSAHKEAMREVQLNHPTGTIIPYSKTQSLPVTLALSSQHQSTHGKLKDGTDTTHTQTHKRVRRDKGK